MSMDIQFDSILSALLGGGLSTMLAKAFISKSLNELEEVASKVSDIKNELSAIAVKLEIMEKDREIILKNDRKIAAIENEIYHGLKRKSATHC